LTLGRPKLASVGKDVEKVDANQLASSAHEFDEIVAPLERRARQRLTRSGRLDCERAFDENPDGFRACVDRALEKGNGSPVGLLVRMVRDRDFDIPPPPPRDRTYQSHTTRQGYESIVELHLIPELGRLQLVAIDARELDRYLARKRAQKPKPLAPRTLNRHLNLLHSLFKAAEGRGLVRSNPVSAVERPREPRRRWRILTPSEIGAVERAFTELVDEAKGKERAFAEQARVIFLTVVSAGLRRGEVLGLRWRDVALANPAGATLRVRETWVRGGPDTLKSAKSERTFAIGRLALELFDHRARTAYAGDDERVFCNPSTGGPLDPKRYAATLRAALKRAKVDDYVRPFHDGRHTNITNAAAAGVSPAALMARAGHSDFATTQLYIDLSGETFREEAELADERLFGQKLGQK
jgi:integrase